MKKNKIKICYILPFYEEGTDTHLFYNYELIKMIAQSEDIHLVIEKKSKLSSEQIRKNLGVFSIYIQKFKWPPLRFLELFFKCLILRLQGCINFYVHYSYYGALSARLSGGKVFYWNRGMPWLFKRGWIEEGVFKFILRHTILVTGPESLAKEYVSHYGVKEYRILSNWVDVARFSLENSKLAHFESLALNPLSGGSDAHTRFETRPLFSEFFGKRIVLFVHHLSKRKGADLIPKIARGFGNDVLFLVAGDGPERGNLENCGINNIKVLGQIPNSKIPDYFRLADVFLMPSREEGSPHVILEAMASGTPFIASDVGGVGELVSGSLRQFLCKSEDVLCFQEKIKNLLTNKDVYEKTKKECLDYVKNFDIEKGAYQFISLFKN